jgi:hypothetical protein
MQADLREFECNLRFSKYVARVLSFGNEELKYKILKYIHASRIGRYFDKKYTRKTKSLVNVEKHDLKTINLTLARVIVPIMSAYMENHRSLFGIYKEDAVRLVGKFYNEVPGHPKSPDVIFCREAQQALLEEIVYSFSAVLDGQEAPEYGRYLFYKYFNEFYDQGV